MRNASIRIFPFRVVFIDAHAFCPLRVFALSLTMIPKCQC